jgi:hypothetical protein
MATKPKRMMFGGMARGAANAVKSAVQAKAAPMKMQNAARSAAAQAAPKPGGMGPKPASTLFGTIRNASAGKPGSGGRPSVMGPKPGMPPRLNASDEFKKAFGFMGPGGMGPRPPAQFMSDTIRNAAASKPGRGGRPSVMGPKPPGGMGPRRPMQGGGVKPTGIASIQRTKQRMGDPGLTMAKALKAGMMKKGGAGKKATKK